MALVLFHQGIEAAETPKSSRFRVNTPQLSAAPRLEWASPCGVALPHFWWSSRPAGCSNILECRAFVDFSRRPDRELAAGGRAAQNCVCFQRDHSSRTNSFPPKVRESQKCGRACGVEGSVRNP